MQPTIQERMKAIRVAHSIIRAENPTDYVARKKIKGLPIDYVAAMYPHMHQCDAVKETKADADVSARNGWETMGAIRERAYQQLKRDMGVL